jgi:hypothetical protein
MKDNFNIWVEYYFDELSYQFDNFNFFLEERGEPKTDFKVFCLFIYDNTIKIKHPYLNKLIARI